MSVTGCLFHWKQANRRQLVKLQLSAQTVSKLMKHGVLDVLTLIPHDEIESIGFDYIKSQLELEDETESRKIDMFFEYFRRTWMNQFSPRDWSVNLCKSEGEVAVGSKGLGS